MEKKKNETPNKKLKDYIFKRGKEENCCSQSNHGPSSAIYGLGIIGALVYYISTATSFWIGAFGIVKALLWPAFLVFELLKYLQI